MKTTRKDTVKGYSIDFAEGTITMNFKFQKAAQNFGSPEYKRLKALIADFPEFTVVVSAGKKITTTRPTKRLTYENMEKYIGTYENADELLEQFETVKEKSAPIASPYKYVRDWFVKQFPNYNVVQIDNPAAQKAAVSVVDAPNEDDYPHKAA